MAMNSNDIEAIVKQVLSNMKTEAGHSAGSVSIPKTAKVAMLTGFFNFFIGCRF